MEEVDQQTKGNATLQQYYDYLKGAKADVPDSYDSFEKTLSDDKTARKYYDYLKANKFDAPDTFDSFSNTLGLKKKEYGLELFPKGIGEGLKDSAKRQTTVAGDLLRSLKAGTLETIGSIAETPVFINRTLQDVTVRPIMKAMGASDKEADESIDLFNSMNKVLSPMQSMSDASTALGKEAQKTEQEMYPLKDGVIKSIKEGKWGEAGEGVGRGIIQSVPFLAMVAATAGAGNATVLGTIGATSAAQRYSELEGKAREPQRVLDSWLHGGFMAAGQIVSATLFRGIGRAFRIGAAKEVNPEFLKGASKEIAKGFGLQGSAGAVTQIGKNISDIITGVDPHRNVFDNVLEAGINWALMGGVLGLMNPMAHLIGRSLASDKESEQIKDNINQQKVLIDQFDKADSDPVKEALKDRIKNLQVETDDITKKNYDLAEKLSPEDKIKVGGLYSAWNDLQDKVDNNEISKEELPTIEKTIEGIKDEIQSYKNKAVEEQEIKPVEQAKEEPKGEVAPVEKPEEKKKGKLFGMPLRLDNATKATPADITDVIMQHFMRGGTVNRHQFKDESGWSEQDIKESGIGKFLKEGGQALDTFHENQENTFGIEEKGAKDMPNEIVKVLTSYANEKGKINKWTMLKAFEDRHNIKEPFDPTEEKIAKQEKDEQLTNIIKKNGGLNAQAMEEAANAGLISKDELDDFKNELENENSEREQTEREFAEEEARTESEGRGKEVPTGEKPGGGKEEKPSTRLWKDEQGTPESVRGRFGVADQKFTQEDVDNIPGTPLWTQNGRNVIGVDDNYMKTHFYSNWTEGGNSAVYPEWNPHGDIHVANNVDDEYKPFVAAHEIWEEYKVEKKGLLYSSAQGSAHEQSNKMEIPLRRFYDEKLKPNGGEVLYINVTDEGFDFDYKETPGGEVKEATMFPDGHMEDGKHGNDLGGEPPSGGGEVEKPAEAKTKAVEEKKPEVKEEVSPEKKVAEKAPEVPKKEYSSEQQAQVDKINTDYDKQVADQQKIIDKAEADMRKALLAADERHGLFGDATPEEKDEIIKREEQGFKYDNETIAAVRKPFEEKIAEAKKNIADIEHLRKGAIEGVEKNQELFPSKAKEEKTEKTDNGVNYKGKKYLSLDDVWDDKDLTREEQQDLREAVNKWNDKQEEQEIKNRLANNIEGLMGKIGGIKKFEGEDRESVIQYITNIIEDLAKLTALKGKQLLERIGEYLKERGIKDVPDDIVNEAFNRYDAKSDTPEAKLIKDLESVPIKKVPISQRLRVVKQKFDNLNTTIPEKEKKTWDRLGTKIANLKENMKAVWDAYSGMPAWTDFKQAIGDWSLAKQINDKALMDFTKLAEKKIPSKARRIAIVNYIEADGELGLLKRRQQESKKKFKQGYKDAQNLSPEEMKVANSLKEYFDSMLKMGFDAGILKSQVENYVTHFGVRHDDPKVTKVIGGFDNGKLNTSFKYAKGRIFDTFFDLEQAGYRAEKDFKNIVPAYSKGFARTIYSRAFIKNLTEGKAADGRPIIAQAGIGSITDEENIAKAAMVNPYVKPEEVSDYRYINHPSFRNWYWATKAPDGTNVFAKGELVVHPDYHTRLSNILGKSDLMKSIPLRNISKGVGVTKQTIFMLSPFFHYVQEGLHAVGHTVNPIWGLSKFDPKNIIHQKLIKGGLQLYDFQAKTDFAEGLASLNIASKIPIIKSTILPIQEYLFNEFIPRLKLTTAEHIVKRNTKRYGKKYSEDQINELSARQANAAYGNLNYAMIGRNPTVQHLFRTMALAPDFLEARTRFVGQALTPKGAEQRRALMILAGTMFVTSRILNKIFDDDYHWDKPFSFIYNKNEYTMRSVPEDVWELTHDPNRFIYNRLSPLFRSVAVEGLTKRDYQGIPENNKDWLKSIVTSPMPTQITKMFPQGWGEDQSDNRLWDNFINTIGVRERHYFTPLEKEIRNTYYERYPRGKQSENQKNKLKIREEMYKITEGGEGKPLSKENKDKMTDLINQNVKDGKITIFQGQDLLDNIGGENKDINIEMFNRLPEDDKVALYDKMSDAEKKSYPTPKSIYFTERLRENYKDVYDKLMDYGGFKNINRITTIERGNQKIELSEEDIKGLNEMAVDKFGKNVKTYLGSKDSQWKSLQERHDPNSPELTLLEVQLRFLWNRSVAQAKNDYKPQSKK